MEEAFLEQINGLDQGPDCEDRVVQLLPDVLTELALVQDMPTDLSVLDRIRSPLDW